MTGLDIVQSVQFVTVKGKRLAVLSAYGRKQNKFGTKSGPSKFINMTFFQECALYILPDIKKNYLQYNDDRLVRDRFGLVVNFDLKP